MMRRRAYSDAPEPGKPRVHARSARRPVHRITQKRGFALLAALWVIVGLALISVGDVRVARTALGTARNRTAELVATWHAEGCAELVTAATAAALADTTQDPVATWDSLDDVLTHGVPEAAAHCSVAAVAAGDRLDVNTADPDALRVVLVAAGASPPHADSVTDAILDWRDADSLPRPFGAEAQWYRHAQRPEPSNRPISDPQELSLIRGMGASDSARALLGTEPGRVVLARAPLPIIAALPGMTAETVGRIAELRWRHENIRDLTGVASSLSDNARSALTHAYASLTQRITSEPDAWIVTITATAGNPATSVTEELRLARAGRRAGVTRARLWP